MKTMKVLVPVRENARNFIDTPVLKERHDKFTSGSWNRSKEKNRGKACKPEQPGLTLLLLPYQL
jgi:hypothetical protein